MQNNTIGANNTAFGNSALFNNTTGGSNIALGFVAGQNLTTGDNNIVISTAGVAGKSNAIRIGNVVPFINIWGGVNPAHTATFVAAISGTPVVGDMVVVDANGHLAR